MSTGRNDGGRSRARADRVPCRFPPRWSRHCPSRNTVIALARRSASSGSTTVNMAARCSRPSVGRGARGLPFGSKRTSPPSVAIQVLAGTRFEKIVDGRMRKPLLDAEVGERVAVEARQAICGAEPQKAARILHDAFDVVMGEAVSGRVGLDRQPLGPSVGRWPGEENKRKPEKMPGASVHEVLMKAADAEGSA